MKAVFLLAMTVAVLVILEVKTVEAECDPYFCSHDCFKIQGKHGECYGDDNETSVCKCKYCIYRGCKRLCARKGKLAQCQDEQCVCL